MTRKLALTMILTTATAAAAAAPAYAGGWVYRGPRVTVAHWNPSYRIAPRRCCYGGVAVGAVAGVAVGTAIAAAARPVYVPPPAVYVPPAVAYRAPVVYPRAYYVVP